MSDQGTDESPRGLNPDYIAGCGRAGQFPVLYREHDLQGCFELVLMNSTAESLSPIQNLTTMRNSVSSLDVKDLKSTAP